MIREIPSLYFQATRAKAVIGALILAPFGLVAACLFYVTIYILPSATAEGSMSVIGIFSFLVAIIIVGAMTIAVLGVIFPSQIAVSADEIRFKKLGFFMRTYNWSQLGQPFLTGDDLGRARLGIDVLGARSKLIFSPVDYRLDSEEMLKIILNARDGKLAGSGEIGSAKIGNIGWKVGLIFVAVIILKAIQFALIAQH